MTKVIEGVIVPLLTPADGQERVDESALRALIRHCINGNVDVDRNNKLWSYFR